MFLHVMMLGTTQMLGTNSRAATKSSGARGGVAIGADGARTQEKEESLNDT